MLLAAMLWIAAPVEAQSSNGAFGPQTVFIRLLPGTPRTIEIGPQAVGVCKGNKGCPDHFFMAWIGTPGNSGESIQIEFTTPGSGDCFDKTFFDVEHGPQNKVQVTVHSQAPLCKAKGKASFLYDVSCVGGEGGDCGGVVPVDPGAMVDGGSG